MVCVVPSGGWTIGRGGRAAISLDIYLEMDRFWSDRADVYGQQIDRLARFGRA
jgi:hypothetical protein